MVERLWELNIQTCFLSTFLYSHSISNNISLTDRYNLEDQPHSKAFFNIFSIRFEPHPQEPSSRFFHIVRCRCMTCEVLQQGSSLIFAVSYLQKVSLSQVKFSDGECNKIVLWCFYQPFALLVVCVELGIERTLDRTLITRNFFR